jgi:hypothetical protein
MLTLCEEVLLCHRENSTSFYMANFNTKIAVRYLQLLFDG